MCKYSPPTLTGLTFHWRLDETQERSLHGQLRHVGGACRWLGIAFPDMPGQWLGQTVVLASQDGTTIGTQNENVAFYNWDADFLAAIVPLRAAIKRSRAHPPVLHNWRHHDHRELHEAPRREQGSGGEGGVKRPGHTHAARLRNGHDLCRRQHGRARRPKDAPLHAALPRPAALHAAAVAAAIAASQPAAAPLSAPAV